MRIAIKILILLLAVMLTFGGIMIYARTKVEPPVELKEVDQFTIDLAKYNEAILNAKSLSESYKEYLSALVKIIIYNDENKIQPSITDKSLDNLLACYSPLFLKRCFEKFQQPDWSDSDHTFILECIHELKGIKHTDDKPVLSNATVDSLNMVSKIITDYRQALNVSRRIDFQGTADAQSTIGLAREFAKDKYLSNCRELLNDLNTIRSKIGQSHYEYISSQVEKLSRYRYFSKEYYENTLIPETDEIVTEYDKKAVSLYGSKNDVSILWNRARSYYDQASEYYGAIN